MKINNIFIIFVDMKCFKKAKFKYGNRLTDNVNGVEVEGVVHLSPMTIAKQIWEINYTFYFNYANIKVLPLCSLR